MYQHRDILRPEFEVLTQYTNSAWPCTRCGGVRFASSTMKGTTAIHRCEDCKQVFWYREDDQ